MELLFIRWLMWLRGFNKDPRKIKTNEGNIKETIKRKEVKKKKKKIETKRRKNKQKRKNESVKWTEKERKKNKDRKRKTKILRCGEKCT